MDKFYCIGVGPGDPELVTLKAYRLISTMDVLLVPETKKGKMGVAHSIIKDMVKDTTKVIPVAFPMVSQDTAYQEAGKRIAELIYNHIEKGKSVGFVTLGDPSIYSTYSYIAKYLPDSINKEIIPGIPSFCAAAAMANEPLVIKDEILSIIPMNANDDKIEKVIRASDSVVMMKVYHQEERVWEHIHKNQLENKGVLVSNCGFPQAEVEFDVYKGLLENKDYLSLFFGRKERH